MGMFDLAREDSKYPGWNFLIGFAGMFLFFTTLGLNLGFGSLGYWLLQGTPDYVGVVKITFWTAILKDWFYLVLMVLGVFLATFGLEGGYKIDSIINIGNKIFVFIWLFLKSRKVKRVIFFSLSIVFLIVSVLRFYSAIPEFDMDTLVVFLMLVASINMMFFAIMSEDSTLFKKL